MTTLKIGEKEYKVQFGYNCFCDTDLLDRVNDINKLMNGSNVQNDDDVAGIGEIKELFCIVRELLYVGFEKYNPAEDIKEIGNLLDEYKEEATEENSHGLLNLFVMLSEELMNEGFLVDLFKALNAEETEQKKTPQDHLKKKAK